MFVPVLSWQLLQAKLDVVLPALGLANVKLWILTGDQTPTAAEIGAPLPRIPQLGAPACAEAGWSWRPYELQSRLAGWSWRSLRTAVSACRLELALPN